MNMLTDSIKIYVQSMLLYITIFRSINTCEIFENAAVADLNLRGFYITKTYLYNFDPVKPHFYIVKLGFTWVYIIFHISAQKHRL